MEGDGGSAALTIWKLAVMLQRKMALSASLGSGVAFAAVRAAIPPPAGPRGRR